MGYRKADNASSYDELLSSFVYNRRFLFDSLAMALIDLVMMAIALIVGNFILLWVNGIPFSIVNGWLLLPTWLVFCVLGKLLPGWGLGSADELRKIERTLFILFASILVVSFFVKENIASSRIVFLFTYLMAAILLPLGRFGVRALLVSKNRWGLPVAIYGGGKPLEDCVQMLMNDPQLGYSPAVIFSDDVDTEHVLNIPVQGGLSEVNHVAPIAVIAQNSLSEDQFASLIHGPAEKYRRIIIIPDLSAAPSLWVSPIDFDGMLGLEVTKNLLNPLARLGKSIADYLSVSITLPLWLPILSILYVLIWLEDRKNPLFLQLRVGRHGKLFQTIKFRTMVPHAEERLKEALQQDEGLRVERKKYYKLKKDPRITRIGRVLRRTSLDELPQLLNVLNGSMSLVGPRPLPSYHFEDLPQSVQQLRDQVKPGITGLWQVSGRSESGTAGMEKHDPYYVRNWSIWLDIIILFRTIRAVLVARGAY